MVLPGLAMAVAALLWPFNLYLPLARHLPRVCITISRASAILAHDLQRFLSVERRTRQTSRWDLSLLFICEEVLARWPQPPAYVAVDDQYGIQALLAVSY